MAEKIPHEVLLDIFSRLPLEDLFRFKLVCKEWSNMIDDPCLSFTQVNNAPRRCPDSILRIDRDNITKTKHSTRCARFHFRKPKGDLSSKFSLVADSLPFTSPVNSCNGLLCLKSDIVEIRDDGTIFTTGEYNIHICNPLKKEVMTVIPHERNLSCQHIYGFGVESMTNTYKVVHILYNKDRRMPVEVHTLATDSWRKTKEIPPTFLGNKSPVFSKGRLFWAPYSRFPTFSFPSLQDDHIVSFDMKEEVFHTTPCPRFRRCELAVLKGDLAIVNLSYDSHIDIWFLRGEMLTCVNKITIILTKPFERCLSKDIATWIIGMWECDEILLQKRNVYYSYNTVTEKLSPIQVHFEDNTKYGYPIFICFRGSMLSPSSLNRNLVN